ncbi:probable WRKY transcription factor 20 [Ipomoea triloba]|uniref:probable WRKY transcription factor 20 n=1 Tax=Ipomoea triloba TaxID=35885 RepID=UPI00125CD8B1|nr:probable WRKY transcription factor 20 [Ipomoea triloba]
MEDSHSHSLYSNSHSQQQLAAPRADADAHAPDRVDDGSSDAAVFSRSAAGPNGGAKYKLMSPAKLPISRSACITIPPGLSPTSFLESPVLLSNVKAEPSPTTGSFSKLQTMQGFGSTGGFSFPRSNIYIESKSNNFEFEFPVGSYSTSESSSIRPKQNEPLKQAQDQCLPQSLAPSSLLESSIIPTSKELRISAPVAVHTSSVSTAPIESDELNQRGQSNPGNQTLNGDQPAAGAERSSEDGYNWRKYGQKLVKGSEFPRSYYKCTYPNCEVKKIFERSPDGQITEIVYKGSHDHPKPQPSRRFTPGSLTSVQEDKFEKESSFNVKEDKLNSNDFNGYPVLSPGRVDDDGHEGAASQLLVTNDDTDDDDPFSKRRKLDGCVDITPVVKPIREPRVVVQTVSEVDILDDGYRWRKYGQKVVRGNPNPRSYYKCTNAGCSVRKHVERASHDPKAVITTYEGKHNHDVPTARTSANHETGATPLGGASRVRPEENDAISLDLGVGIGYGTEHRPNGQLHSFAPETLQGQVHISNSGMMTVQPPPMVCYGTIHGGINRFGSTRQNMVQAPGFDTLPLQPANQCPQTLGRVLLGP